MRKTMSMRVSGHVLTIQGTTAKGLILIRTPGHMLTLSVCTQGLTARCGTLKPSHILGVVGAQQHACCAHFQRLQLYARVRQAGRGRQQRRRRSLLHQATSL